MDRLALEDFVNKVVERIEKSNTEFQKFKEIAESYLCDVCGDYSFYRCECDYSCTGDYCLLCEAKVCGDCKIRKCLNRFESVLCNKCDVCPECKEKLTQSMLNDKNLVTCDWCGYGFKCYECSKGYIPNETKWYCSEKCKSLSEETGW